MDRTQTGRPKCIGDFGVPSVRLLYNTASVALAWKMMNACWHPLVAVASADVGYVLCLWRTWHQSCNGSQVDATL